MTTRFMADVNGWTEKTVRNADEVVNQSIQDVGNEMTRPADGLVRGASFEEGVVPVDQGDLINSSFVTVDGSKTGQGASEAPPSFVAALAGFRAGQYVTIGFSAAHARIAEYGANGVPGRFFVRNAVQKWRSIVDANAAKLRD